MPSHILALNAVNLFVWRYIIKIYFITVLGDPKCKVFYYMLLDAMLSNEKNVAISLQLKTLTPPACGCNLISASCGVSCLFNARKIANFRV